MLSKNLSLIATILITFVSSIELGASDRQNNNEKNSATRRIIDSKSNAFKTALAASTIGLKAGIFMVPIAVSKYRLGKKLANPSCTLTPQSIKNRGLVGIAIGITAMLPFGIITGLVLSEVKQEERTKKLFEEKLETSEEDDLLQTSNGA